MLEKSRKRLFIPFLLPALILHTTFWLVPKLGAIPYSLMEMTGMGREGKFVGLANFQELLGDPRFYNALVNNVKFMIIGGLVTFPLAIYFGWAMTQPIGWRRFFKFVIFAPAMFSPVIVGLLWAFSLNPYFGVVNELLRAVGLGGWARAWVGDFHSALPTLAIVGSWQGLGFTMILFLAGLQKIPKDLYDAARIDGAGGWQVFWYITWPLLWEITRILLILHIIGGLQSFALVWVMTKGGPAGATEVMGTLLFKVAFQEWRMGYATAIGFATFILVLSCVLLFSRVFRRETVEY